MNLPGYDAWKTRLPDFWDEDDAPSDFWCDACEDIGWLVAPWGVIPCTECSAGLEIEDLGD